MLMLGGVCGGAVNAVLPFHTEVKAAVSGQLPGSFFGGVFALPAGLQQTGFYRLWIIDLPPPPFIMIVMWFMITEP